MYTGLNSKALQKLEELGQREGESSSIFQLYRQLLPLQIEVRSRLVVSKSDFDEATISERLAQGIPILSPDDLSLNWEQVKELVQRVAHLLATDGSDSEEDVGALEKIAAIDIPLLEEAVRLWYQGEALTQIATTHGVDGELLTIVIGIALEPFLSAYSEALSPLVNQESWRRRYCPICGGKPDFAFLEREVGARWLLCLRCDTQWLFQRLECPYCGTTNQNSLAYFTDDDGLYRLYVCEECRSYIKAIDLRHCQSEVLLPIERLLTLNLDRQAQEAGYKSGA